MDYASKNREDLLYNRYLMGRNSLKRAAQDSWTVTPKRVAAVEAAAKANPGPASPRGGDGLAGNGDPGAIADPKLFESVLHDPAERDPRGYILPLDQPDLPTTVKVPERPDQVRHRGGQGDRRVHGEG